MIRAIFFDLDDTLIGYSEAERVAFDAGCDVAVAHYPTIDRVAFAEAIYHAYERRFGYGTSGFAELATISVADLRRTLTTDALRQLDVAVDAAIVAEINRVFEQSESEALRPFADTARTLDVLAAHFPLGVITNGPSAMQRAKMAALELAHRFQVIVVDSEFGHPKPDTRIFDHAARSIGCESGSLLFVGNSLEADVAGSVAAGWTSVWVNADGAIPPSDQTEPHFTVRCLDELLTISPVAEAMNGD